MRRVILPVLVASCLPLGSCCTDPVDQTSYFCLGELSVAEEQALGNSYAPSIAAEYGGPYYDPQAFEYLNGLIMEMATHSVRANDFTWRFTILDTSMPNAFAVPGGYIYITRGLLAALETEGQFISVMGHELGHVEHRHTHKAMGKQTIGAVLVGAVQEAETSLAPAGTGDLGVAATAAAFGTQLVLLSYDRGQESQADERGIYYAYEMGYDPMEGKKTFEYFQKLEDAAGGAGQIAWLRTHPMNDTRVADIDAKVRALHPDVVDKPKDSFRPYKQHNDKFAEIAKRIASVQPIYDEYDQGMEAVTKGIQADDKAAIKSGLSKLSDCASKIPNEPLFHTGVGLAQIGLGDNSAARAALAKAITIDDQRNTTYKLFDPRYFMGIVLMDGNDFAGAVTHLKSASAAFPANPAPYYNLGVCAEKLGQKADATTYYKKTIELEGDPNGNFTKKANERLKNL